MRSGMDVSLSRLSARILLVAATVVCAGLIALAAGQNWLAAHWAATHNPTEWKRAAELESGNAAYWSRIGLYEQWDFVHGNIHHAIEDFQRATRLNPRSARNWMALAGAYESAGKIDLARQAYERAQTDHPVSAQVAWRFGSFLLRRGDSQLAAEKVHRALLDEPDLTGSAVSQFWKAGAGIHLILDRVLPPRPPVYLDAIAYFISLKENDAALACWEKLAGLGRKVALSNSLDLIDSLLSENRVDDAAKVWKQALVISGRSGETGKNGSLIFNGGFEQGFVNGGFGWRQIPDFGTAFDLVGDVTHGGVQSARVVFDGTANVDYANLYQYVPVTPGASYRLSAFMRTDSISTDSGPQFTLMSCPDRSKLEAQTPVMTGTHPWTKVEANFTAGPAMHCVTVTLRRKPSSMFDNKIRGTVWVDQVRLQQQLPSAGVARR
jgi:tetratricopeptide (TPR) repeat protein